MTPDQYRAYRAAQRGQGEQASGGVTLNPITLGQRFLGIGSGRDTPSGGLVNAPMTFLRGIWNIAQGVRRDAVGVGSEGLSLLGIGGGAQTEWETPALLGEIGKSLNETLGPQGLIADLPASLISSGARERTGRRVEQFSEDPFMFGLEHIGNTALAGAVLSKPAQLGMAASRGALTGTQALGGLRLLAGRGTRAEARVATQQAAREGSTFARGTQFAEEIIGHPYRTAYGGIKMSGPVQALRNPVGPNAPEVLQRIRGADHLESRGIAEDYLRGKDTGLGKFATAISGRIGKRVGSTQNRRAMSPRIQENLFETSIKNLGERKDASLYTELIADLNRIQESVPQASMAQRLGETLSLSREIGLTTNPQVLVQQINRVFDEVERMSGGNPAKFNESFTQLLPDSDPMGLYLTALDAAELAHNLPTGSLQGALADYTTMDRAGDINRRAQEAIRKMGAEDPTPARFRIPEEHLNVDVNSLPPEVHRVFEGAARQYRRDVATFREPGLVAEGRINAAGTRAHVNPDAPSRFSTNLEDLPLTDKTIGDLKQARDTVTRQEGLVNTAMERLAELEGNGNPLRVRDPEMRLTYRQGKSKPLDTREAYASLDESIGGGLNQLHRSGVGRRVEPGGQIFRLGVDEIGFPVRQVWRREGNWELRKAEVHSDLPYVFRAVTEEDWQRIQREGVLNSDGRMNIDSGEGMVTAADPTAARFYLPKSQPGRVLRIRVDRADGWRVDPADQYIKTNQNIDLNRVESVTPRIDVDPNTGIRHLRGQREVTQASLDRAWKTTPTGAAVRRWRERVGTEKERLLQARSNLERLEREVVLDVNNAPASAREALVYAREVAPRQARILREMGEQGQGNPEIMKFLADELDNLPKTLDDLNSADVYLTYLKQVKHRGTAPRIGTSGRVADTRPPSGLKRRDVMGNLDVEFTRNFRSRAYWQDIEFQNWYMRQEVDKAVLAQGLAKTGRQRLEDMGVSANEISAMDPARAQQIMEQAGLRVYSPAGIFGTGRKPLGNPLDAEWITPYTERNLMKTIKEPHPVFELLVEQIYDPILNGWKVLTLPLRPAWQVNNAGGNAFLTMLAGKVSPFDYPSLMRASRRAISNWNKGIIGEVAVPMHHTYRAELTAKLGTLDPASSQASLIRGWLDKGEIRLSNDFLNDLASGGLTRGNFAFLRTTKFAKEVGAGRHALDELGITGPGGWFEGTAFAQSGVAARGGVLKRNLRQAVDYAYHLNEMVDNLHRATVYMDQIGKGASHMDAMAQITRALSDYTKLSSFERGVLKRIFPFYPWMKHMLDVLGRSFQPDNITRTIIVTHVMSILGEPNEFEAMLPGWADGHIYLGDAEDGTPRFLSTRGMNPFLDIFDPIQQPNLQGLVRPMTPFLQAPLESVFGTSILTGRPFTSAPGSDRTRPSIGEQVVRNVPQLKLGRDIYRDLMNQPLTRYGTGEAAYFPGAEDNRHAGQTALQMLGFNIRAYDVESMQNREKVWEYQQEVARRRYAQAQEKHGGRTAADLLGSLPGIGR